MTPAEPAPLLSMKLDSRMVGAPRYVLSPVGENMRTLAPDFLSGVYFLAARKKGEFKLMGTGFFVNHPLEDHPSTEMLYMVTARHVIEDIKSWCDDALVHARVNRKDHGAEFLEMPETGWHCHEDPRIDVAIAQVVPDRGLDHGAFKTASFATDSLLREHRVGPGKELFFPGLFARHAGQGRNLPIVRTGTVASMPHERLQTKLGPMEAYLVEVRSIGGLSGSPVFVETDKEMDCQGFPGPVFEAFMLGMVQGHYGTRDLPDSIDDSVFSVQETRSVNMGIGIVVPAKDILSAINSPRFVESRRRIAAAIKEHEKQKLPELD